MDSLHAVDAWVGKFPLLQAECQEYAGPQCFPHLVDERRMLANAARVPVRDQVALGVEPVQLRDCWLRCQKAGCRRWRLVEAHSYRVLCEEGFRSRRGGQQRVNWGQWLAGAAERYEACVGWHRAAMGEAGGEVAGDVEVAPPALGVALEQGGDEDASEPGEEAF